MSSSFKTNTMEDIFVILQLIEFIKKLISLMFTFVSELCWPYSLQITQFCCAFIDTESTLNWFLDKELNEPAASAHFSHVTVVSWHAEGDSCVRSLFVILSMIFKPENQRVTVWLRTLPHYPLLFRVQSFTKIHIKGMSMSVSQDNLLIVFFFLSWGDTSQPLPSNRATPRHWSNDYWLSCITTESYDVIIFT